MSEKLSEITVKGCGVHYEGMSDDGEGGYPVFSAGTQIYIKGTYRKMAGTKEVHKANIGFVLDISGEKVADLLVPAGASVRIEMQKIRDLDDFAEVAKRLEGKVVKLSEVSEWNQTGKEKLPFIGRWLLSLKKDGKPRYTRTEVEAICADEDRKKAAQDAYDALMKTVEVNV